jgi:ectoine hydroxylase-related dioxygenase (phytanoyl-CoA dioxygenase family)
MSLASTALPDLNEDYTLTADQIASFERDGHILLRGVASPAEAAAYRPAITRAVDQFNTEKRPLAERDAYGMAFLQVMNLWLRDEMVCRYVLSRRFAKIAAELMGVGGVRIYHDQALYKEAGGGITPWHQDQYYWPVDTDHTITLWMPLMDVTPEMGTLVFASESQRNGYLGNIPISQESEKIFKQFVKEHGYQMAPAPRMAGGDATFHGGWTLHSAPGNQSKVTREVMTIIYIADGCHATQPDNPHREADLANWLPGVKPGDLAASPLNPLVYSEYLVTYF